MARNGIFWTIREQTYFVKYPFISYQKIKVYRLETKILLEQWSQWANLISISTMDLIVQDKILW